jgi:hypothetical protein
MKFRNQMEKLNKLFTKINERKSRELIPPVVLIDATNKQVTEAEKNFLREYGRDRIKTYKLPLIIRIEDARA